MHTHSVAPADHQNGSGHGAAGDRVVDCHRHAKKYSRIIQRLREPIHSTQLREWCGHTRHGGKKKSGREGHGRGGRGRPVAISIFLKATARACAAAVAALRLRCNDFRVNSASPPDADAARLVRAVGRGLGRPRPPSLRVPANILLSARPHARPAVSGMTYEVS